jgi:hypothetical protein
MIKNKKFDDYLYLLDYNFSNYKYIIFKWNSWSWKSSYINKILEENKSLNKNKLKDKNLIYIDEVFNFLDLLKIFKLLINTKKRFIIASHISFKYFFFFRFLWKIKQIETDKNTKKIYNYLNSKKITFSEQKVLEFIKIFWATYTDIDIILEKYSWNNFDKAFNFFIRSHKIKLTATNQSIKIITLK